MRCRVHLYAIVPFRASRLLITYYYITYYHVLFYVSYFFKLKYRVREIGNIELESVLSLSLCGDLIGKHEKECGNGISRTRRKSREFLCEERERRVFCERQIGEE